MGHIAHLTSGPRGRDALISRLVRQVCLRFETHDDPYEILRACLGASLGSDVSADERHHLITGVELRLAVGLTPFARGA